MTLARTRTATEVAIGDQLPELEIDVTPTFVVSTAIATRDFQNVHHDRDSAVAGGSQDIFLNILTTTGLVQRFVTDWAGPEALVRAVAVRLGVPCHAYDTLRLTGRVAERVTENGERRIVVAVSGAHDRGEHVAGTVRIALPEEDG